MKTPLLDLGNVILRVDFEGFFLWLSKRSKLISADEIKKFLTSSLWAEYEFGTISKQDFIERARKLFQADFTDAEFEEQYCNIFPGIVPGMDLVLSEMAEAGPVYCLSNTNEMHQKKFMRDFVLLEKVTKIFASHEIHKRKPYPGVYQDVVNEIGIKPKDVIFFDDLQKNIDGAKKAGLEAHLFQSAESTRMIWRGQE